MLSAIDKPSRATLSRLCCLPLCAVWHTLCATLCGTSVRCLDACRIALALSGVHLRWLHVHVHVRLSFGAFHFVCLAFGSRFVYGFALAAGSCFVCAAKCRFRFTTRVCMSVCARPCVLVCVGVGECVSNFHLRDCDICFALFDLN